MLSAEHVSIRHSHVRSRSDVSSTWPSMRDDSSQVTAMAYVTEVSVESAHADLCSPMAIFGCWMDRFLGTTGAGLYLCHLSARREPLRSASREPDEFRVLGRIPGGGIVFRRQHVRVRLGVSVFFPARANNSIECCSTAFWEPWFSGVCLLRPARF